MAEVSYVGLCTDCGLFIDGNSIERKKGVNCIKYTFRVGVRIKGNDFFCQGEALIDESLGEGLIEENVAENVYAAITGLVQQKSLYSIKTSCRKVNSRKFSPEIMAKWKAERFKGKR